MGKSLLSIDWDYFIATEDKQIGSFLESKRTIIDLWYKRYLQAKQQGEDIQKYFRLFLNIDKFWEMINEYFQINKDIPMFVSDSHVLSYTLVKDYGCDEVYLLDAHADLGYGGLFSLNFEVNCANWLGKLFKNKQIKRAHIIYSPFTFEKPEYFKSMNDIYDIEYPKLKDLHKSNKKVAVIHICRSGAWTPPWYDMKFFEFVNKSNHPYNIINCPPRKWNLKNISFSDQINYFLA